jgi:hypothetical protein
LLPRPIGSTRRFLDGDGVRVIVVSISKASYRRRFPRLSSLSWSTGEADSGEEGSLSNQDRTEEESDCCNIEINAWRECVESVEG